MSSEMNGKIINATVWSSVTEILAKLVAPIVNLILARVLAPEAFGAVATITIVTSFAEIFADAGFQKFIIQHEFKSKEDLDKSTDVAFWSNLCISILIVFVIVFLRKNIAALVGNPSLDIGISVASLNVIFIAFSSIQTARLKRDFNFKNLFIARIGASLIPLVVTVPAAFIFKSYWALILGTLVSNLFVAVVLSVKSPWNPKRYYSFTLLRRMLSFSLWTMLESLSFWLTTSIGTFIVGNFLNEFYLGLYKTSMTTVNSYMGLITAATTPVLFSALSRFQNDDFNFKKSYYTFQRNTAILIIPMGVGAYLFSDLVTKLLLGNQWEEASEFIGLWALVSAFSCVLGNYNGEVLRSKGKPKISLLLQLQHLAFLIPTLLLTAPRGFETLYIARSFIRFELIISGLLLIKFLFGFRLSDVFKNIFPSVFSAMIMATVGMLLKSLNCSVPWQFVCILICVVVYFAVLFLLFPKIRKEVLSLPFIRKVFTKLKRNNK